MSAIAIGSLGLLTLFFITSALEETPEKRKARELGYLKEWVDCDFVNVDETFESAALPQIPKPSRRTSAPNKKLLQLMRWQVL